MKQIAPEAEVIRLVPIGDSPHLFDPTPRDIRNLIDADLIILNGHVDQWALDLIDFNGTKAQVVEVSEKISFDVIEMVETEEGRAHNNNNPHIWLDPWLMVNGVLLLTQQISAIDSNNKTSYLLNSKRLTDHLWALDEELKDLLKPVRGATFVPFHDAWPYFARRYNLDLALEIEPLPGRHPSAAYLAYAIREVKKSGAKAIFSEVQLATRSAEVIAESAGVSLFVLDPLGGQSETESYQDLLRYNANIIAKALR